MQLLATTTFGLEQVVTQEIKQLGYFWDLKSDGKVFFTGDEKAIARSNLWLRAADRVFLQLAKFPAKTFVELFDSVYALDWLQYLDQSSSFPVYVKSKKSQLTSTPACQSIVKKAIAKKLTAHYGIEQFAETGAEVAIHVWLEDDQALVLLDTSGVGLHKRGYRLAMGQAPLKETLAAGILLLSGWKGDTILYDPFCGSGTFALEAAQLMMHYAPGLKRQFAFQSWHWYQSAWFEEAHAEALAAIKPLAADLIYASDHEGSQIAIAETSQAEIACPQINFFVQDALIAPIPDAPWTLMCNPPYGIRVGNEESIIPLYERLAELRQEAKQSFILSAFEGTEDIVGPATKRRKLYNGDIQCFLYQYLSQ